MGVVPERHLDVLVAHDVLQRLRVHARFRHLRAERVAQRVRCHVLGKRHSPALRVLAPQPPEHPVVVAADPRQPVPVEEDEARSPIDAHGLRLRPRCHDMLERGHHLVGHVDVALAALRLRLIDPISPADCAGELVVHENHPVRQVDVRLGQPAHLRYAQPRPEEDDNLVDVPVVDGIRPHETEQRVHLFPTQRLPLRHVPLDDGRELEIERVLAYAVIGYRQVERRLERTLVVGDGGVGEALGLHALRPFLRVGRLHAAYLPRAYRILEEESLELRPRPLRPLAHVEAASRELRVELADRHLLADGVYPVLKVTAYLALLLAQRLARPLTGREPVGLHQPP